MVTPRDKPERNPPERIVNSLVEHELKGFSAWDSEDFSEAEKVFMEELILIKKTEEEEKRGIHKGAVLHNLGLTYAFEGKMSESIRNFLLAYIEDTLSNNMGEEDEADGAPAYRVLRYIFRLRIDVILEINNNSLATKEDGKWRDAKEPESILTSVAESLKLDVDKVNDWVKVLPKTFSKKDPLGFPQNWEHRVFIGGAYRNQESMKALYKIKEAVRRKDFRYVPIMGFDVYVGKEIRHRTLLLLHTCKWAIFEVTFPAGQLVEIERSLDYETHLLILYKTENGKIPDSVSSMTRIIPDHRRIFSGYNDVSEIPSIVEGFLPKFEDAAKDDGTP